ncbi:TrmB family transcriptional regulator sugar-binding domain-containing protein [Methanococcus maripaludis]|jgi:hypothetical protein|uniref:Transcription regulator TrmB C-terminal domain-containing protein n=1 Tax=Methanococcus maripaludis TaxID=39152 RepID=A0A8T3VVW8_METMI|nr:TrmB family transcriptional regulator sugar-binding domain-containing protein [Methanococcus maripaludis]MBG0768716.1 hypothetical protein [Methanococcus maripaludis]
MKKIGILEFLVLISILVTALAIGYNFLSPTSEAYTFDGEEMYKCAWVSENIMLKGFPLYADIDGRWTADSSDFSDQVQILAASGGTLTVAYNNTEMTIGGKLASKEDIAASNIYLVPLGNTIIRYNLDSLNGTSFSEISDIIYSDIGDDLNILEVDVDGSFAIDSETFSPTEQLEVINYFKYETALPKMSFVYGGLILKGYFNLNDLKNLDGLLNPQKIVTSNIEVNIIVENSTEEINTEKYNNAKLITWM